MDVHPLDVHPLAVHPLDVPRWGVPVAVGPCPAIAVPMGGVRPMPKRGVTAAVIATDAAHGMAVGNGRGMAIAPQIDLEIDKVSGSVIAPQIDPESVLVIAPESGSVIAPVPSTGIRTTAQGQLGFAIGTIDTVIVAAPEMNGVSPPSAPVRVLTRAVPNGRMQCRRLQRPRPRRMT